MKKGFKDFLAKDESLSRKITYEEFSKCESGFDDSGIEKAYEAYKKFVEENSECQCS